MSRSFGFDATLITFVTRAGDFSYPHDHPTPPVDAFVVYRSGAVNLSRTTTTWTATEVSLNASVGGVVVTLLLFGQKALVVATKTGYIDAYRRTVATTAVFEWPNAATQSITAQFPIPLDWSGGAITVKLLHNNSVGSNTVVFRRDSYVSRAGVALTAVESAANVNITVADTNVQLLSWSVAVANYAIGDAVVFVYSRLGADGSDSNTGDMQALGLWFEYATT